MLEGRGLTHAASIVSSEEKVREVRSSEKNEFMNGGLMFPLETDKDAPYCVRP